MLYRLFENRKNHKGNSYEETVNAAGIINSAIGTGLANGVKAVFTSSENKPATKKDIKDLIFQVQKRYQPVKKMRPNSDGTIPYYDTLLKTVRYFKY